MLNWTSVGKNAYEASTTKHDFSLRKEQEEWVVDVFDTTIEDADEAFIESESFDSIEEAKAFAQDY